MKQALTRGTLPVEAYERLRELIVTGRLAPGTRLIETEVAERLGLSRTPVRSALNRLLREGYVNGDQTDHRARLTVAPLTREDASELFNIVAVIEGLAGHYSAELPADSRGRLAVELRIINNDLRKATGGDPYFELDQAFHHRIVAASGRRRVIAHHDAVKPQAERYIRVYTSTLANEIATSAVEHDHIIEAIESGDPDEARRAVETNFTNAAARLSKIIDTIGERGSW